MGTSYNYSEGATYQSESTPITVSKIPTGTHRIIANNGEFSGGLDFSSVIGTQNITLTLTKPYSLIYDKSLASDPAGCLTYAGKCEGFTPMVGGAGNADEGSWAVGNGTIFDAIKVGCFSGSTFIERDKSALASNGILDSFTRIPRIYQKVTDISDAGDNSKVRLDLSLAPFNGATLHPAFIMDGAILTYKDIGRYLASSSYDRLISRTGQTPIKASESFTALRTYAKANGSNYGLLSYYDWDLVNKLYLLAFKSFNSQSALGQGYVNKSSKVTTGGTNSSSWMYGYSSSSTNRISVLGIEDWWGNYTQMLDNFLTDSSYIYASNSSNPSDDVSNMTAICPRPTTSGIGLTCRAGLTDFFIIETSGGSSTNGMCDYQQFNSGSRAYVGGYSKSTTSAGAFFAHYYSDSNDAAVRLVHWE